MPIRPAAAVAGAVMLAVLAGCVAPTTTHQGAAPAAATSAPVPTTPGSSASGAAAGHATTSNPATNPVVNSTTNPPTKAPAKQPTNPSTKPPTKSPSAPPAGAVTFDPFGDATCTWVPRMFVDLSGNAKPGVRVVVPLLATGLSAPVTLIVRGELNGDTYRTADSVRATPPEWHGSTSLAMAVPASSDYFSVYVEVDVQHRLSDRSAHTGIVATLPTPRPTKDTNVPCKRVT